jgi:hypothetical protein
MSPQDREHLCKLLGMLGSNYDAEVTAAGRKAHAHIKRLDLTWDDVVCSPPESWLHMVAVCAKQMHLLNGRERNFIANVMRLRWPPSEKQLAWLEPIFSRLQREAA